jgi:hypothetical protein
MFWAFVLFTSKIISLVSRTAASFALYFHRICNAAVIAFDSLQLMLPKYISTTDSVVHLPVIHGCPAAVTVKPNRG